MARSERISDAELEVMQVLWDANRPITITEIRETLQRKTSWEPATIKTLVHRLVGKGAVAQEKDGVFYYRPLISRQSYSSHATQTLVSQLFHGNAMELVATLVKSDGLTREDLDELRAMFKVEE